MSRACVLLVALAGLGGCSAAVSSSDDTGVAGGKADGEHEFLPIVMNCSGDEGEPVDLPGLAVTGDVLKVDVAYSGGCKPHKFTACWDGSFLESFPVQAQLVLRHDAHGDACEMFVNDTIYVDLRGLANAYRAGYEDEGEVIVDMGGSSVSYVFGPSAAGLEAAFAEAAEGASYASETDSAPTFITAPKVGSGYSKSAIVAMFGETLKLDETYVDDEWYAGYAMEIKGARAARAWMADLADPNEYEDETAAAWGRIAALFGEHLNGLHLVLIGPKDIETGALAEDAGTYYYLVIGESEDGTTVSGFYVDVAWT